MFLKPIYWEILAWRQEIEYFREEIVSVVIAINEEGEVIDMWPDTIAV